MKSNKKNTDLPGSMINSLSAAIDTINDVQNLIQGTGSVFGSAGFLPNTAIVGDTVTGSMSIPSSNSTWTPGIVNTANSGYSYIYQPVLPEQWQGYEPSYPKVDIYETNMSWTIENKADFRRTVSKSGEGPGYKVEIFVAGVPKENVSIELLEGTNVGSLSYPPSLSIEILKNETKTDSTKTYILKESKQSRTKRIVSLPADADLKHVTEAVYKDGVLSFKMLKLDEPPTAPVPVKVKIT